VPAIYAGIAGIELMQEIGVAETREHVLDLNSHLLDGLDDLRMAVAGGRHGDAGVQVEEEVAVDVLDDRARAAAGHEGIRARQRW